MKKVVCILIGILLVSKSSWAMEETKKHQGSPSASSGIKAKTRQVPAIEAARDALLLDRIITLASDTVTEVWEPRLTWLGYEREENETDRKKASALEDARNAGGLEQYRTASIFEEVAKSMELEYTSFCRIADPYDKTRIVLIDPKDRLKSPYFAGYNGNRHLRGEYAESEKGNEGVIGTISLLDFIARYSNQYESAVNKMILGFKSDFDHINWKTLMSKYEDFLRKLDEEDGVLPSVKKFYRGMISRIGVKAGVYRSDEQDLKSLKTLFSELRSNLSADLKMHLVPSVTSSPAIAAFVGENQDSSFFQPLLAATECDRKSEEPKPQVSSSAKDIMPALDRSIPVSEKKSEFKEWIVAKMQESLAHEGLEMGSATMELIH